MKCANDTSWLIPKKGGAKNVKNYRLISLVDSLYELLAKVLVNKLKKPKGKVVSRAHNAFLEVSKP